MGRGYILRVELEAVSAFPNLKVWSQSQFHSLQICNDFLRASAVVKALDNEVDCFTNASQLTRQILRVIPCLTDSFQLPTAHNQIIIIGINFLGCSELYSELESACANRYRKESEDSSDYIVASVQPGLFQESSYDSCKHSIFGFRTVCLVGSLGDNLIRDRCLQFSSSGGLQGLE